MKVTAPSLSTAAPTGRASVSLYAELFKARLTLLVLLTTVAGLYLGAREPLGLSLVLNVVLGTGSLVAGAAALNQFLERDYDARMSRTRNRPLPSGKLQPASVLGVGVSLVAVGIAWLTITVNPLTAALGALSAAIYTLVYTPLKRVTWLNTLVGAIPGGLPPLMGWAAVRGELSAEGFVLLAVLAFWQLPHFLAIAWIYRDEYSRAGFQMLPVVDSGGRRTGRQAVLHTLALVVASLCPFLLGLTGGVYAAGALVLGAAFAWCAFEFRRCLTEASARRLFFGSILYLPLLLGLMVLDKTG